MSFDFWEMSIESSNRWPSNHRMTRGACVVISTILLICILIEPIVISVANANPAATKTIENRKLAIAKGDGKISRVNIRNANQTSLGLKSNKTAVNNPDLSRPVELTISSLPQVKWQLDRHSYNLSAAGSNQTSKILTQQSLNKTSASNDNDELKASDSRLYSAISSREDDEPVEGPTEEDVMHQLENYLEGASSNLNEKKVIKEFTKILSKSMSGATDQLKLETLEDWKKRQRERKVTKDARAKLFEDLITAAINSHPEKARKKGRRKDSKGDTQKPAATTDLTMDQNVDPELAVDAESVIQHIQGLASAIDGSSYSPALGGYGSGISNSEFIPPEDDSGGENSEEAGDTATESAEPKTPKKPANHDRPIVRQFKKLKNQLSQRRKQLDQIKKMFNVDLSLNPKDGSLMGKPSRKKEPVQSDESEDDPEGSSSNTRSNVAGKRKASKSGKMKELMEYLRDNPEILVSVMSELTADAEPPRGVGYPPSGYSESPSLYPTSSMSSERETMNEPMHSQHRSFGSSRSSDSYDFGWNKSRRSASSSRASDGLRYDQLISRRSRSRGQSVDNEPPLPDSRQNLAPGAPLKVKSAEALLLESLRERQLMNLARLDMVLAERQQASNRSNVYATSMSGNSNMASTLSRRDSLNYRSSSSGNGQVSDNSHNSTQAQPDSVSSDWRQHPQRAQSDGEVLHHFMMLNQGDIPMSGHSSNYHGNNSNHHFDASFLPRLFANDRQPSSRQQQLQNPNNFRYNNHQVPALHLDNESGQQQAAPLGRFRDWRDVSQTESSPHVSSDKTNYPSNVTWVPYDLSTGGTANAVDAHKSASINDYRLAHSSSDSPIDTFDASSADSNRKHHNKRHLNARSSNNNDYRSAEDSRQAAASSNAKRQAINKDIGDLSVTRAGSPANPVVPYQAGNELRSLAVGKEDSAKLVNDTVFMQRSSGDNFHEPMARDVERPTDDNYQLHEYADRLRVADRFESRKESAEPINTKRELSSLPDNKPAVSDKHDFINEGDGNRANAPTNYFSAYRSASKKSKRQSIGVTNDDEVTPSHAPTAFGAKENLAGETTAAADGEPSSSMGSDVTDDDMGAIWASS